MGEYVKKWFPIRSKTPMPLRLGWSSWPKRALVLERDGFLGLVFQRGEPTKLRFRIDSLPSLKLEQNKRRREQLEKRGWQYAGSPNKRIIIYKNLDLNQKELPEPEEYGGVSIQQNVLVNVACSILAICTLLLLYKSRVPRDVSPTLYWLTDGFSDGLGLVIFIPYLILLFGIERVRRHRLQQRKRDGSFEARSYHTQQRARRNGRRALIGLGLGLLLIVVPNMDTFLYQGTFYPIQEYQQVLPVPPLSELVRAENEARQAAGNPEGYEEGRLYRNEVFEERYPLLVKLTIYQQTAQTAEGTKTLYYPRYYKLRYEGLAERLYQDLQNERDCQPLPWSNGVQVSYSQKDQEQDRTNQVLLLQYGTEVLEVAYGGELDLSKYVELYINHLTATDETQASTVERLQAKPAAGAFWGILVKL